MWSAETGSAEAREGWYSKGLAYWDGLPATVQTVLGGYERVSPGDIKASEAFLKSVFPAASVAPGARPHPLAAAELGAGVGRVTENLLLRHFERVDVVEPVPHYLAAARAKLEATPERALRFVQEPLQSWTPEAAAFDVIWVQWCLGHLTDGADRGREGGSFANLPPLTPTGQTTSCRSSTAAPRAFERAG
jgi:protein N-terminal methyltransferase